MTNKLKPQKFEQGQWAWSPLAGWGKCGVTDTRPDGLGNRPVFHEDSAFTLDGKQYADSLYPTLLSIENAALLGFHPPEEARKAREFWINVYDGGGRNGTTYAWETKEIADRAGEAQTRTDCIKVREVLE